MAAPEDPIRPIGPALKVFQASPLAYEDWSGKEQAIAVLDLETESTTLKDAMDGTGIDVVFEMATANNLGKFLAQGNRFLHFSCHGHPKYLFIENDYGGAQMLLVDENLKAWIRAGGNKLSFVFVSACQSRNAGEAFKNAGVEHVVCCERNEQNLSNTAAIVFARDFYRALVNGRTLQEAFDLAINAVIQSPEMWRAGLNPLEAAKKFALLPQDANHNVSLSFEKQIRCSFDETLPCLSGVEAAMLPEPSQNLSGREALPAMEVVAAIQVEHPEAGRKSFYFGSRVLPSRTKSNLLDMEMDMYQALRALMLRKARLLRITGKEGICKHMVAKAVGQYMARREMWGEFFNCQLLAKARTTTFHRNGRSCMS